MRFFEQQDEARGQTVRLVVAFALAVLSTVAGVHAALALAWMAASWLWPGGLAFPAHFMAVNVGVTLLLVLGGWWIEVSNLSSRGGAEKFARRAGARELRPGLSHAEQRLANIVSEVCIAAHMPQPQVMVVPRAEAINAFAAGWDEDGAVLAVTQGALDLLTRDELQGLVAHECSHIHEGDTRLNMQLAGMVCGLELVYHFGETIRERGGFAVVIGAIVGAMGWFGWISGRMLQAAVARQREYLADARAVQWTRSRDGLGRVLRKVLAQRRQAGHAPSHWHPAVQHMLLVGGLERDHWFDPHPPLADRVRRIYGRAMPPVELDSVGNEGYMPDAP